MCLCVSQVSNEQSYEVSHSSSCANPLSKISWCLGEGGIIILMCNVCSNIISFDQRQSFGYFLQLTYQSGSYEYPDVHCCQVLTETVLRE